MKKLVFILIASFCFALSCEKSEPQLYTYAQLTIAETTTFIKVDSDGLLIVGKKSKQLDGKLTGEYKYLMGQMLKQEVLNRYGNRFDCVFTYAVGDSVRQVLISNLVVLPQHVNDVVEYMKRVSITIN